MLADQPTSTPAPRNRLLAALPPDDLARLRPRLEAVELPFRQVLHAPGEPIEAVYFPETGWSSMLAYLESGDAAEVGLVGYEGMVGLPVLLGADRDDIEAMVQCQGTALRMDAQAFREELERIPARPCSRVVCISAAGAPAARSSGFQITSALRPGITDNKEDSTT